MGITVADTEDSKKGSSYLSGLKACYLSDVVYGDITFEWDALRTEYQLAGTRGDRPYDVAIVDEVDSMLIEEGAKLALLGGCQPDMEQLQPLLIALWVRLQYENTPDHFIEEDGSIFWQANKESERIEVRDRLSCLEHILEAHAKALISEKDSPILVPAHLKVFAMAQAKYWAKSAVMASEKVHLDRDYVLSLDAEGKGTIAPIDFMNTGVTQLKSAWTNGLHQFLQMKHGLVLTPETLTTSFISNKHYFSRYGANLYGVTGTLGGLDSQLLLTEVYPLDLVFVPTFKEKQLTMLPGILAENDDIWLSTIIENVKRETESGRAVLVICETNLIVAAVEKALTSAGILKLRRYARSDLAEHSAPTNPMDEGEVMIATSLGGRGTDLKTTAAVKRNKGLHVCLTYLPNKRGRDQAFGRTARQGQEGSAQLIANQKAIKAQFDSNFFMLGDADTLDNAILWRDNIEEARLKDIKDFELKKVGIQEHLFERFSQLRKRLRTVENNQYRLADLEERWAFWLKTIDNQMLTTDNSNEALILDAYDQFEKEVSLAYLERKLQNPGYWISEGNRLSLHHQAEALAAYQEASTLDPIFAFPSYYAEARQQIVGHGEKDYRYKAEALENLRKAKAQIETYLMPQIQATQLMYAASLRSDASPKTDLLKQYKDKEFLLQRILENIEESIGVIERAPEHVRISNSASLLNLFYDEPPEAEIAAFSRMGLTHLVSYEEVPEEKEDSLWDAFVCTVWGIAQIVVGVGLTLCGQIAWGGLLISEGISDLIFTAQAVMGDGFNWKDYRLHKEISLAINAVSWGVDSIRTSIAARSGHQTVATTVKQKGREALVKVAKTQVTQALVSAGIQEGANAILNAASREILSHFKDEIEKHVRSQLKEAMSDPALEVAITTLLSIDFQNKNQRCEQQIQQIVSSILSSQQSRLKTIVSSVINGVLSRQSKGEHGNYYKALSVVKTVHDIAQVSSQLSDFCDRFCEEFKSRVRFLVHKNSAGITIEIEDSYCKPHSDTLILSITDNVRQYITRALHQGVVRPICGTLMDKEITKFSMRVQDAIYKAREPEDKPKVGKGFSAGEDPIDGDTEVEDDDTEIEHKDDMIPFSFVKKGITLQRGYSYNCGEEGASLITYDNHGHEESHDHPTPVSEKITHVLVHKNIISTIVPSRPNLPPFLDRLAMKTFVGYHYYQHFLANRGDQSIPDTVLYDTGNWISGLSDLGKHPSSIVIPALPIIYKQSLHHYAHSLHDLNTFARYILNHPLYKGMGTTSHIALHTSSFLSFVENMGLTSTDFPSLSPTALAMAARSLYAPLLLESSFAASIAIDVGRELQEGVDPEGRTFGSAVDGIGDIGLIHPERIEQCHAFGRVLEQKGQLFLEGIRIVKEKGDEGISNSLSLISDFGRRLQEGADHYERTVGSTLDWSEDQSLTNAQRAALYRGIGRVLEQPDQLISDIVRGGAEGISNLLNKSPCPQPGSYGLRQIGLYRPVCNSPVKVSASAFLGNETIVVAREDNNAVVRYGFFSKPDPSESTEKRFSPERVGFR